MRVYTNIRAKEILVRTIEPFVYDFRLLMATPLSRLRGITLCYDWPVTLKRLGRGTLKVTNTDERFWIWAILTIQRKF